MFLKVHVFVLNAILDAPYVLTLCLPFCKFPLKMVFHLNTCYTMKAVIGGVKYSMFSPFLYSVHYFIILVPYLNILYLNFYILIVFCNILTFVFCINISGPIF